MNSVKNSGIEKEGIFHLGYRCKMFVCVLFKKLKVILCDNSTFKDLGAGELFSFFRTALWLSYVPLEKVFVFCIIIVFSLNI